MTWMPSLPAKLKMGHNSKTEKSATVPISNLGQGYGVQCHLQQYFSYIAAVSFIGRRNRSTLSNMVFFLWSQTLYINFKRFAYAELKQLSGNQMQDVRTWIKLNALYQMTSRKGIMNYWKFIYFLHLQFNLILRSLVLNNCTVFQIKDYILTNRRRV